MAAQKLDWSQLTRTNLDTFIGLPQRPYTKKKTVAPSTFYYNEISIKHYLHWLHESGLINIDVDALYPKPRPFNRLNIELPNEAHIFLRQLSVNLRPSTVANYQKTLRHFFIHLNNQGLGLDRITLDTIQTWLELLKNQNQRPISRLGNIIHLRIFLRWCYDRGLIATPADTLVRSTDFPKTPKYLPRPLPVDADRKIQNALENSTGFLEQGLLLMRLTGIRKGELAGLSFDCVREDINGHKLLKVPLGKLNTERMVPLDPRAATLIERLRAQSLDIHRQAIGRDDGVPRFLFIDSKGRRLRTINFDYAITQIRRGVHLSEPITSHRFRHTFATELLNGGMSLPGVMKMLGHKRLEMTLIYAAVTQDTLREQYFQALQKLQATYPQQPPYGAGGEIGATPDQLLADALRWITNNLQAHATTEEQKRSILLLVKRIQRIRYELQNFVSLESSNTTPVE